MTCPDCGGEVEQVRAEDGGKIADLIFDTSRQHHGRQLRRVRPATFYACVACEWCNERPPTSPQFCDGCGAVVSAGGCACD
jgi:hypothetical protein